MSEESAKKGAITVAIFTSFTAITVALIQFWPFGLEHLSADSSSIKLLVETKDADDSQVISGAIVEVVASATVEKKLTGTDGRAFFVLSGKLIGSYAEISAEAPGYDRSQELISLSGAHYRVVILKRATSTQAERLETTPAEVPEVRPQWNPFERAAPKRAEGERNSTEDVRFCQVPVKVFPEDASLYVDGRFYGSGSDVSRLRRGLTLDGQGSTVFRVIRLGYEPLERTVQLDPCPDGEIVLRLVRM